jgi:hypothetical protein
MIILFPVLSCLPVRSPLTGAPKKPWSFPQVGSGLHYVSLPHQRFRRCRHLKAFRPPQMQSVLMPVHVLALFWIILDDPISHVLKNISLMKHISRQSGVRFTSEPETGSQPSPSVVMTRSVQDWKGIKNAPLLPISSVEPNSPSCIRY